MTNAQNVTLIEDANRPQAFVMMRIGGQLFGLPVKDVRDVMHKPELTPVPLAPELIAGLTNLRGEIVTVIDMRVRLGLPTRPPELPGMLAIVEYGHESVALLVDSIVDVTRQQAEDAEEVPATMGEEWKQMGSSIYTIGRELMLVLNVARVLTSAAA